MKTDHDVTHGAKMTSLGGKRGARYLTGQNLEVVWAEFSTLS
jgi:hypothetical protein